MADDLQLPNSYIRYSSEFYMYCDSDGDTIQYEKGLEMFKRANLPMNTIQQILELCKITEGNSISCQQFLSALKLIACVQAGYTLHPDLLTSSLEVPLPRFSNAADDPWPARDDSPDLIQLSDATNTYSTQLQDCSESTDNETSITLRANGVSSASKKTSPDVSSESLTPTNSGGERGSAWCEEQRRLLGTEEESDRHSSDDEGNIWVMTSEQKEYYAKQFRSLPNPAGLVSGHDARIFFEKSRLPVQELSKIWQLADIGKDGALSLSEFSTAMHLIVARRNNIPLPDKLPPSLIPSPPSPTAVKQDPKILHPVPVRVTPEVGAKEETWPSSGDNSAIRPIQRPQPKKNAAPRRGALPPPPQTEDPSFGPLSLPATVNSSIPKKDPPPPPPPRPRTHTRSSSLDLNRLAKYGNNGPPIVPPRVSPSVVSPKKLAGQKSEGEEFADFTQLSKEISEYQQPGGGAFKVYKKPVVENNDKPASSVIVKPLSPNCSLDDHIEHNAMLKSLCQSLQNELTSLRKERTILQLRFEQLHCP
ncbi:ralBP1-associated Eps domain-containing protein 2 isoform X2 [Bemisia tabaci]|uniref:ralBP1-associated Eps domain-containing protein 2 isoform X2 n=1 Tax=Bemisia tabaci TaxID=7038 RepID=UPI0008F988C4|nr:PREDICTED: ralBP1-associated Eps domain-containing protein 1 isoform X2 [Bemisia tabaci]